MHDRLHHVPELWYEKRETPIKVVAKVFINLLKISHQCLHKWQVRKSFKGLFSRLSDSRHDFTFVLGKDLQGLISSLEFCDCSGLNLPAECLPLRRLPLRVSEPRCRKVRLIRRVANGAWKPSSQTTETCRYYEAGPWTPGSFSPRFHNFRPGLWVSVAPTADNLPCSEGDVAWLWWI